MTDKGVAIVFSWVVAPLFVVLLIVLDQMTSRDLAIVAGGGGLVIPLVIGMVRKLFDLVNPSSPETTSAQRVSKKVQQQEAETIKQCETIQSNIHQRVADTLQSIEQLKTIVWNLPYHYPPQKLKRYRTELYHASQQLALLHDEFTHELARVKDMLAPLKTQQARCAQLRQAMDTQGKLVQTSRQEMGAFIKAYDQKQLQEGINKAEVEYLQINPRATKVLETVHRLTNQSTRSPYAKLKHTLQKLTLLIDQIQQNSEKLDELLPPNSPPTAEYESLATAHQTLVTRLQGAQLKLHKMSEQAKRRRIQQSPAYQQQQYEAKKEQLSQKQQAYTLFKQKHEEAQNAVNEHLKGLWAKYAQHHPNSNTHNTQKLTAFLQQHYPEELEQFSQKRQHQAQMKSKQATTQQDIEALTQEVEALQLKYAFDKNTEDSILQLWQSYEHSNNHEEFWQAYEQRLQTLDIWRQTAYLLKS
ncbi:hypothetical protein M23134_00513 [Microscilla marina ATCC 23134]|uniref:Uncharacterized protein n=1 Tax=Microscilla marina ATCC 23134 TaxID=313606 RepID=A1ZJ93_MICM2|nr:hypothetical protein M23134_00513 [Microscilla marina ATCC 23134]